MNTPTPSQRVTAIADSLERSIPEASRIHPRGDPDAPALDAHFRATDRAAGELAGAVGVPQADVPAGTPDRRLQALASYLTMIARRGLDSAQANVHSEDPNHRGHALAQLKRAQGPLEALEQAHTQLEHLFTRRRAPAAG